MESSKKITFRLLKDNIIILTSENHKASIERFKISKKKKILKIIEFTLQVFLIYKIGYHMTTDS